VVVRARIVLPTAAAESISEISRRLSVSRPTVITWRERFAAAFLEAHNEDPKSFVWTASVEAILAKVGHCQTAS